jgi:hypothetical protein
MMLNTYGTKVDGNVANPGTMNNWLKAHGGYVSGNLYVWGSIGTLGYTFIGFGTNANAACINYNKIIFKLNLMQDIM